MKRDALESLGSLITEGETRDAVHIACLPAQAIETLRPGQRVRYKDGRAGNEYGEDLGIVDPFLGMPVRQGEWFWIMLYPRTITGLRHLWTHPMLPEVKDGAQEADRQAMKMSPWEVIEKTADFLELESAEELLTAANYYQETGSSYCFGYQTTGGIEEPEEFWAAWEVYTGKKMTHQPEEYFWRCAC